jgi:prepilin-type N-terminal cleavage/methylation domain-containing protein
MKQRGFTLIELLISTGLTLIVAVIGGGILLHGIKTQENSDKVTVAANTAQ